MTDIAKLCWTNLVPDNIVARIFFGGQSRHLVLSNDSLTFTTAAKTAVVINKIVRDHTTKIYDINSGMSMLNMTGNHGGDQFPFLVDPLFTGGIVCELDYDIYTRLYYNMTQFVLPGSHWIVLNVDSVAYSLGKYFIWAHVIFVDPPFGQEYKDVVATHGVYSPKLGSLTMGQLVSSLSGKTKMFALKLPKVGFDLELFKKEIPADATIEIWSPEDLAKIDGHAHKISFIIVTITGDNNDT